MFRYRLYFLKKFFILAFIGVAAFACFHSKSNEVYSLEKDRSIEASIFRQHCALCHGFDAEGKTLDDGKIIPSLRHGDLKFRSKDEIYEQITAGGNGMTPFRDVLTDKERRMMADFVHDKLR